MTRSRMVRTIKMTASLAAIVLGLSFPCGAMATPVIGEQLYYAGGDITVTVLPYSAAYTSNLYLFSTGGPVFIANSSQVGTVVDLGNLATLYGIHTGDELIFGVLVLNTGNTFVMGPGSRNLDGIEHVSVDYAEGSSSDLATLGFEDLFGGGDFDYNDAMFKLEGGIGLFRVPEPASLILLLLGLAAAAPLVRSLSGVRRREDARSPLE
jgi:uncharacterized protein DUF4114/PEP-CTERM motif-containing protein